MSYLEEIDKLIETGELRRAKEMCWEHENDENNVEIQLRHVDILLMEQKYYEAEEICYKYPNNYEMQKLLINVLIKHGKSMPEKYQEAKALCEKYMENDVDVKVKYVKILIKEEKYDEAEKICKENITNIKMLSQLIKSYIKQNKLEEAKKICEEHFEEDPIKSQYVTVLITEGKLEQAKEVCQKYSENIIMQSQLISILILQDNLDEAKKVAEAHNTSQAIKSQLRIINHKLRTRERSEKKGHRFSYRPERKEKQIKEENKGNDQIEEKKDIEQKEQSYINIIKTRIYLDYLPRELIEEIRNSDIDDWQKVISIMAIYKKKNENRNAEMTLKEAKRMFKTDPVKLKKLNSLSSYITSNKQKMFDWNLFDTMLKWKIDEKYAEDYRSGKIQVEEDKEEVVVAPKIEVIIEDSEEKGQIEPVEIEEQKEIKLEENTQEQNKMIEEKKKEQKQEIVTQIKAVQTKVKKNKNKEKEKNKKLQEKELLTMSEKYRTQFTKLKAQISAKANSTSVMYIKDLNSVENLEEKSPKDLRVKMQFILYLRKYGLDKDANETLPQEYEVYDLINKLVLYKKADPRYDSSKLRQEILDKVSRIEGNNEYIHKILDDQR
ncbi:MAG: hypothetical protein J6M60_02150 [Clostridia bacterium]|nr:hypothetical protein [Clostridia bacterium]